MTPVHCPSPKKIVVQVYNMSKPKFMNSDCRTRRQRKFDNQRRLINFNLNIILTYNIIYTL